MEKWIPPLRMRVDVLPSKDELDIVGEEEDHVGNPLPFVHVKPIVECHRLSTLEWVSLKVVFLNDNGVHVAEGIC